MPFTSTLRLLSLAAGALLLSACAHVGEEDFQAEMTRIRAEMTDGDAALGARIDGVEASVAALEQRMNSLESELQTLAQEYDAQVSRLEASLRFAAPVHFDFDVAEVRPGDRELLMRFASVVREHYPEALVTVEGFTDPSGSTAYNLQLGQRRADAVRGVLVDQGRLTGDRVRAVSYGEDTARLINTGAAGRENPAAVANRRVVLVVDHATQVTATVTDPES
ncbi:MAG: OmpA family protein [Longimicrobiales bacterium]|nr:OmpA family protein [Longimicrobiales bacterium]